jgi:hypothetical protein
METHPVTIIVGTIGTIILVALTGMGLTCVAYKQEPQNYPYLKLYYEWSKSKKIC